MWSARRYWLVTDNLNDLILNGLLTHMTLVVFFLTRNRLKLDERQVGLLWR